MNKKSQAAMEFLMTYGWAILLVLIVIGALAYFNILNLENFRTNKCKCGYVGMDYEVARLDNFIECGNVTSYIDEDELKIKFNQTKKLFYCHNETKTLIKVVKK